MALDILRAFGSDTGANVTHQPKHDLESIIYVIIWICVLYPGPNSEPLAAHTTCLKPWAECKSCPQVEALWSMKTGELVTQVPLQHFSPYFRCLNPFAQRLHGAILSDHQNNTPLSHNILRSILLNAFFPVEEPRVVVEVAHHAQRYLGINTPMKHKGDQIAVCTMKQSRH
jgi:hypothetical protein